MQLFKSVQLTPDQIEFLKTTDFDMSEIPDSAIVLPEVFICAAGLVGFTMGKLQINEKGEVAKKDQTNEVDDEDIALITSYIKQQVRDMYGVQLQIN